MNAQSFSKPTRGRIIAQPKTGDEAFRHGSRQLPFLLRDFWRWSASDLVSNAMRGCLAEFIVAKALGIACDGVRDEWGACDLVTPEGARIQVKSASYVQAWHQDRFTKIQFSTAEARGWDADAGKQTRECKRCADVYVFAVLKHLEKGTIDPLDVDQWEFYVVPTTVLDEHGKSRSSISLANLRRLSGAPVGFENLRGRIKKSLESH